MDIVITLINTLIRGIASAINFVIGILPSSPFVNVLNDDSFLGLYNLAFLTGVRTALGYLSYFIPIPQMIVHFTYFLTIVGIYYGYRVVLNWTKVLRG